jgi:hypothetical protein
MAIPQIVQPATGLAGGLNLAINDIPGPKAYITGGVFVSASALGLASVKFVSAMDESSDGVDFVRIISIPGQGSNRFKWQWFRVSDGAEIANGIDLSGKTMRVMGLGV